MKACQLGYSRPSSIISNDNISWAAYLQCYESK